MNVIANDYVFIGMDKTGSSSLRKLIREIEGDAWVRFPEETSYTLPSEGMELPVVGSIRNPFTWYPSYWTWYGEERFKGQWKSESINATSSFGDWVRENKDAMVREAFRLYKSDARLIRMEKQSEDLIRVLQDIKGPLPSTVIDLIQAAEVINANPRRPRRYVDYYTDELKESVLEGAFSIFENYYPEREFPREE